MPTERVISTWGRIASPNASAVTSREARRRSKPRASSAS
ncbi:uncharacterized protein METZ01_LOCUS216716, partial [marine metagenome]